MKISQKLILGYLLVASLASLTTYFTIGSYQDINAVFETMVNDPLPAIKALEGIGQGGTRIVASTNEIGFIGDEAALGGIEPDDLHEEELIESGRSLFQESLKEYENLAANSVHDEALYLPKIKAAGEELIETSRTLIEMKKNGLRGAAVLEKKEEFERHKLAFLKLVEEAKQNEYRELEEEQREVEKTIAVATRRTLFITVFTFLMAIACGVFISHQIAKPIIALKQASKKVQQGETDTVLDVKSNDEIGDLGRCFNKMVGFMKESQSELLSSKNFVDNIFTSMPDILFVINLDGTINRVNRGMLALTGFEESEVVGHSIWKVNGDRRLFPKKGFTEIKQKGYTNGMEKYCRTKSGGLIPISMSASVLRDADGKAIGFVCVAQNISDRKQLETKLTHQALHDPLTGFANRVLFHNRVEHALALAARSRMPMAVLFLDLDNFKNVNDSLGHAAGDELLKGVARRIGSCLRASDTAARLGGDEFALLLEQLAKGDYAPLVAERIIEKLRAPFVIGGKEIFIQTSIGIALTETGEENPEELLRNADVAMYMSKSQGKGRFTVFENKMREDLIERLELEADLRRGIENDEFTLFYQPIVEFKTKRITGMEALARWHHPKRGLVMPAEFIPIAEETGMIVPLGQRILEKACLRARAWQLKFPDKQPLSITVNLSGRQFQQPEIVEQVADALAATGLPPEFLVLEITESMMMLNTESMIERLHELKRLGVRLAIDDFGTGFSSLSYLHRFPIDIIKIDRSFVDKIGKSGEDAAVARAIIMMSYSLRLKTIAEGIEKAEQSAMLENMGCEFGQGYYFAKPLNERDFTDLLIRSSGSSQAFETEQLSLVFKTTISGKVETFA